MHILHRTPLASSRRPVSYTHLINDTLIKTFGDTHTVILGIEHFKAENLNPSKNWTTREEYYQSMENTSYFLQDEWNFDQRWKLTSGIRYDSPSGGLVEIDSNISKSFNLGYKFNPETNIYVDVYKRQNLRCTSWKYFFDF